nr:carnosine N-methyltransferase isoform X1 [Ipomoea trifida]
MLNTEAEAEEVERRRKLEEALEVKALRRIISAFINYPEASEEDIKRYERSFRKLPQAHKVILSHLPLKFQKLRWCIAQNSYFIFEMLKAFEPPLDLSQDTDICEDQHLDNITTRCCGLNCKESVKPSSEEHGGGISGTCVAIKNNTNSVGDDWCKEFQYLGKQFPSASCNENISSSSPGWLSPLSQSHVPLVDVDKVRCIIRNIVRDWAAEVFVVLHPFHSSLLLQSLCPIHFV